LADTLIRTATETDLPRLLRLLTHLNPDDPVIPHNTAAAIWRDCLARGIPVVLVAEAEDRLVASCSLAIIPNLTRGGRPYAVVENVVTDAAWRGRGLGRRVLAAAADHAWNAGCYKVMLATGSRLEATLRFYEGAGFDRASKTYFEMRRGAPRRSDLLDG
jgi:GNAT superfamily N-acetyltransferase